jgi:hypothetical protein
MERATEHINEVLNERIEPVLGCVSEEVDESENRGSLVKIVGKTYAEFVEDAKHDVVVLYYMAFDTALNVTREFQDAADEVVRNGTTSMKFGFINIHKNIPTTLLPYLIHNPHVEMFRAKNRSEAAPMLGAPIKEAFIRFFKDKATLPNNIQAVPINRSFAQLEKTKLQPILQDLPPDLLSQAEQYIERLDVVIRGKSRWFRGEL